MALAASCDSAPCNMGCTSSTANVPESQTSTTDNMENNITCEDSGEPIKENDIIDSNTKELEKKQVLPEYESNHVQIANDDNIKSTDDNVEVDHTDVQNSAPVENRSTTVHVTESSPLKDNMLPLKVVEKVISENADENKQITNVIETGTMDLDRQIEEIITESYNSEGAEAEINEEEAKESPSPTQSEDSRATRWEALADIAAELPPSLAVDPLTGQIYSLTK